MKCWICGEIGVSGEHLIKDSDLRIFFGKISQRKPVYYHSRARKNIPIGSSKNFRFKSKALICHKCNTDLTQPYDRAWEAFSRYVQSNWRTLKKAKRIDLVKIFPGQTRRESVNLHLYFVKNFGCRISENDVPIDIHEFSASLLSGKPCSVVYLTFGETPVEMKFKFSGLSEIHSSNIDGKSIAACYIYTLGEMSVKITFAPIRVQGKGLANLWHPDYGSKTIKFGQI